MTAWQVLAPGALTTVQDLGRHGSRHVGVARAGALDPAALAMANRLVGNDEACAGLEVTLQGPRLRLPQAARIALVGASLPAWWNEVPLPMGRPLDLPPGELRLGTCRDGLRAWLAVAGGIDVPSVLGSRSTDLRGGFGGHHGRVLQAGDTLAVGADVSCTDVMCMDVGGADVKDADIEGATHAPRFPAWWIDIDDPWSADRHVLRYVPSTHPVACALAAQAWQAHPDSNRQGLRLAGAALPGDTGDRVSEPVAVGTLQLPPDGQPILLMADAQTVGGYARLGHVLACDLGRAAQLRPGERVQFEAVDGLQAAAIARQHANRLARLRLAMTRQR